MLLETLTSAPVQCWCCFQKQNVHRVALGYYKKLYWLTIRQTDAHDRELPCPLMWIQLISFSVFKNELFQHKCLTFILLWCYHFYSPLKKMFWRPATVRYKNQLILFIKKGKKRFKIVFLKSFFRPPPSEAAKETLWLGFKRMHPTLFLKSAPANWPHMAPLREAEPCGGKVKSHKHLI